MSQQEPTITKDDPKLVPPQKIAAQLTQAEKLLAMLGIAVLLGRTNSGECGMPNAYQINDVAELVRDSQPIEVMANNIKVLLKIELDSILSGETDEYESDVLTKTIYLNVLRAWARYQCAII